MRKLSLVGIAILVVAFSSLAAANTLTPSTGPTYQQQENSPCVIGDPSCKNGGFIYTEKTPGDPNVGNNETYDFLSPVYVVGSGSGVEAPNVIPQSFIIGVDENIAKGQDAEVLEFFQLWTCTDASGSDCSLLDSTSGIFVIPDVHNGNGYSDFLITGFSTLPVGTYVQFRASVSNDTDGMEEFFIIPQGTPAVPEPASLFLVGSGLAGLSGAIRRKMKE